MAETVNETLWGGETEKAIGNFQVSGEPIPTQVARWLGRIKAAAARVNADLDLLDRDLANRIAAAGRSRARSRGGRPAETAAMESQHTLRSVRSGKTFHWPRRHARDITEHAGARASA